MSSQLQEREGRGSGDGGSHSPEQTLLDPLRLAEQPRSGQELGECVGQRARCLFALPAPSAPGCSGGRGRQRQEVTCSLKEASPRKEGLPVFPWQEAWWNCGPMWSVHAGTGEADWPWRVGVCERGGLGVSCPLGRWPPPPAFPVGLGLEIPLVCFSSCWGAYLKKKPTICEEVRLLGARRESELARPSRHSSACTQPGTGSACPRRGPTPRAWPGLGCPRAHRPHCLLCSVHHSPRLMVSSLLGLRSL